MYIQNLILGAGISGLAAANMLNKDKTLVFEKENYSGGLCNSFNINGFTFDTAVHFSFTKSEDVRSCFDKTPYYNHKPIAYNYLNRTWLKHPVENNLFNLNTDEKIKCIKGFVEKPILNNVNNYEEWLLCTYGDYIYNKFHKKYTTKYWCIDPSDLSTNWVEKRFNIPSLEKILKGAFTEETDIDYYTKEMRYPKYGGYKSFLNPLLENVNLKINMEASKIDLKNKIVYFKDGSNYKYTNLISSIPLPNLIALIDDVPKAVVNASKRLKYTSVTLASVGFNKDNIPPYLWFYIYDSDILASRVYSPSKKSINNAPRGCSSLQFELYHTKDKPLNKSFEELKTHIKNTLQGLNLCKEEDISFIDIRNIEYGNVIFYKGMEEDRKIVLDFLDSNDVNVIGRFGEWDYFWSDQSFLSGKKVGEHINTNNKRS